MGNLFIALIVTLLILGGPLTLYFAIKILNSVLGGLKAELIPLKSEESKIALKLSWDPSAFDIKIFRIKADFVELIANGRSFSHSFTFEDSAAKKKAFILPIKLPEKDIQMLTDGGLDKNSRALKNSKLTLEVETLGNETQRFFFKKAKIMKILSQAPQEAPEAWELLEAAEPDRGSVLTRVFPWKDYSEPVEDDGEDTAAVAGGGPAAAPQAREVDFVVTKVWIEPGCIVCDACENEAPDVFQVLEDTCIVRENAPLGDAGSIAAAAEGCPVDVIKFDKAPKSA